MSKEKNNDGFLRDRSRNVDPLGRSFEESLLLNEIVMKIRFLLIYILHNIFIYTYIRTNYILILTCCSISLIF